MSSSLANSIHQPTQQVSDPAFQFAVVVKAGGGEIGHGKYKALVTVVQPVWQVHSFVTVVVTRGRSGTQEQGTVTCLMSRQVGSGQGGGQSGARTDDVMVGQREPDAQSGSAVTQVVEWQPWLASQTPGVQVCETKLV